MLPSYRASPINGPIPQYLSIDELPGVYVFAVGGERANDELVSKLRDNTSLKTLTLAYADVSESVLMGLPIGQVEKLFLPGCKLTDSVVDAWPDLRHLTHLDVSHTQITGKSLEKLLASPNLVSVNLDGCKLTALDLAPLRDLTELKILSLAGVPRSLNSLGPIIGSKKLKYLNLSGETIDDGLIDSLIKSELLLELLVARDSGLSGEKILEFCRKHDRTKLDIGNLKFSSGIRKELISTKMLVNEWEHRQKLLSNSKSRFISSASAFCDSTTDA